MKLQLRVAQRLTFVIPSEAARSRLLRDRAAQSRDPYLLGEFFAGQCLPMFVIAQSGRSPLTNTTSIPQRFRQKSRTSPESLSPIDPARRLHGNEQCHDGANRDR